MRTRAIRTLLCLTALASCAWGQENPPPKLAEFREAFKVAFESRATPGREKLAAALRALEGERTTAGDYEGAIRARDRRIELTEVSPIGTPARDRGIDINIASGNRAGSGLKYDLRARKIVGLSKTSQSITWDVSNITPGKYRVLVTYSCGGTVSRFWGATGGKFSLGEEAGLGSEGSPPLVRKVTPTGDWEKAITRTIGEFTLTGAPLVLRVLQSGSDGLMHLYGIRLVPAGSGDGLVDPFAGSTPTKLRELRAQFTRAVADQTAPITATYGNDLRSIRNGMPLSDESEEAREVDAEFTAAERISRDPELIFWDPEKTAPPAAAETSDPDIGEFEETYRSELVLIRKDLGEKWLGALAKLRDELTREQRFAEAFHVRSEENRVTGLLEGDPLPPVDAPPVKQFFLTPWEAELGGNAELDQGRSAIEFPQPAASATWPLPDDLVPGTYELILHYRSAESAGGRFAVSVGEDQTLIGTITPADENERKRGRRSSLVGECELDGETLSLSLKSTQQSGPGLMALHRLELAPQGSWAEMQSKDTPGSARAGEFEKLEGARWIDKESRRSGEIVVRHGEKEHTFRLYYVKLPPSELPTSRILRADLARSARQLRTTEERILRFGKKVDSDLRDAVWTEDLTIYTRWETRGRQGPFLAFVLVGDRPLSLSLIDHGHARLGGAYPTEAPFHDSGKRSARSYQSRLREAEKQARGDRRGIWGL